MPNHVTNILNLEGSLEEVKKVFMAIAPGPSGEIQDPAKPYKSGDPIFKPASAANLAKRREGRYEIDFNKIVPQRSPNYSRDWSIINWGTKWNAYDIEKIDDYTISFNTAWSFPEPVIKALSKMFPKIGVNIKWADEDTGSNCGEIQYKNGIEVFSNVPDDQSKEAYELSFEINGGEENYRYDNKKGKYVWVENESVNVYKATADLKKLFETKPVFKAATPEQIANRPIVDNVVYINGYWVDDPTHPFKNYKCKLVDDLGVDNDEDMEIFYYFDGLADLEYTIAHPELAGSEFVVTSYSREYTDEP